MRLSQLLAPTLREAPAEAEIISHNLMLRAGLIRKLASGVYSFLPLGYRVIKKIENIIREEMDKKGGQELLLPAIQPAELWEESGRWAVYGKEMMRLKDRHDRSFCLGPTHEEVITDLVRREVRSYRQLPLLLYQIQTKYRDEIRPRFGLMRAREFIMKDAYSFDIDADGLEENYRKMYDAYCRIFERCGLTYRAVEADSGAIGGNASHEFMVTAESGENAIVYCENCSYAANIEKAECLAPTNVGDDIELFALEPVHTPNVHTIEEVANYLKVNPEQIIKTLIYKADEQTIAVLVRGDREINEIKLKNVLDCQQLGLADDASVQNVTGAAVGFAGPVGLKNVKIIADYEVAQMRNAVCGANQTDMHYLNANPGRDFNVDEYADLRIAVENDKCPKCKGNLKITRGIEVGHIFKLGTKYSKALNAIYLDENGQEKLIVMGCYGIGVGRTAAAAIEQNHDENGIIWPMPIAPFHVVVIPVKATDAAQYQAAEEIYNRLIAAGVEAVFDDRNERAGVKFKDADLIGFPIKVVVGPRSLAEGKVEVKIRKTKEEWEEPIAAVVDKLSNLVQEGLKNKA